MNLFALVPQMSANLLRKPLRSASCRCGNNAGISPARLCSERCWFRPSFRAESLNFWIKAARRYRKQHLQKNLRFLQREWPTTRSNRHERRAKESIGGAVRAMSPG